MTPHQDYREALSNYTTTELLNLLSGHITHRDSARSVTDREDFDRMIDWTREELAIRVQVGLSEADGKAEAEQFGNCANCGGTGKVEREGNIFTCGSCNGSGKVTLQPGRRRT